RPTIPTITAPTLYGTAPVPLALGDAPADPADLDDVFPTAPVEPTFGTLPDLNLPAEPDFNVAEPLLSDIALPDPLDAILPTAPTISDAALPVDPDFQFPDVPTLEVLQLPATPTLDLPLFEETLGDGPAAPSVNAAWAEVEYQTTMLTQLNGRLLDFVSGEA